MNIRLLLSVSSAIALAACSQETATVSNQAASAASGAVSAASAPAAASAPVAITAAATAPAQVFNIESLPVSTVPLGQFPYFSLPANYKGYGSEQDSVREYARFPFFVGDRVQLVEGKMYSTKFTYYVGEEERAKNYSSLEVEKNLESVVTQLGGTKVFGGKIPDSGIGSWVEALRENFPSMVSIYGDDQEKPVFTYVIRRNDGNIWICYITERGLGSGYGSLFVVQEKGFAATAKILDAGEMKKQIDSAGKVDLQVNFATDKTEILPESQPQIDEVFKLLQSDPALKLSINGHTDNTGGKAHNQSLSEGRAHSVVATLVGKGIAADRLKAAGFGDSRPIADNGTEEGKAKNRRVELVKQ